MDGYTKLIQVASMARMAMYDRRNAIAVAVLENTAEIERSVLHSRKQLELVWEQDERAFAKMQETGYLVR